MRHPLRLWFLCCLLVLAAPVRAVAAEVDLVLDTGQEVQGTLERSDRDHVAVALPDMGQNHSIRATLIYARAHVLKLTLLSPALPEYQDRERALPDTAEAHAALAAWCESQDLVQEARTQALRAEHLAPSPDHAQLLLRLGMTYADGAWQVEDQYLARTGRVRFAGTIMTQEEATALQVQAGDHAQVAATLAAIQRAQAMAAQVAEDRVALAHRERQLQEELTAVGASLHEQEQRVAQLRAALSPAAHADAEAVAQARRAAADAAATMPTLLRRRAAIVQDLLGLPADREALAGRERDIAAALAVAQQRLAGLRAELASYASSHPGR